MYYGRDLVYVYDGTFLGLMSVVFECYYRHVQPYDIEADINIQSSIMCEYYDIETDFIKAERVINAISEKISKKALTAIFHTFLSELLDREINILKFIKIGFKSGASVIHRLNFDCVAYVMNASKKISSEAHLYLGFIRFQKLSGGIYFSRIEPKGRILPLIITHFQNRFSDMPFIICDMTHSECIVFNGKEACIQNFKQIPNLHLDNNELHFQDMWREFYNTISIKERNNERYRMSSMPKRFWKYITELS